MKKNATDYAKVKPSFKQECKDFKIIVSAASQGACIYLCVKAGFFNPVLLHHKVCQHRDTHSVYHLHCMHRTTIKNVRGRLYGLSKKLERGEWLIPFQM
jgi:hypothetical protein